MRLAWEFIVSFSVQDSACLFLVNPAPLLKKECYIRLLTLIADTNNPIVLHRAGMGAGFPAYNCPVNVGKLKFIKWA